MLKIISGHDVKKLDQSHLEKSGLSSLELMEKAANSFLEWWLTMEFEFDSPIYVICGAGNNGGDGLAIARLLFENGYAPKVYCCFDDPKQLGTDAKANWERLPDQVEVTSISTFVESSSGILIDAYLGVGWKGSLREESIKIIQKINRFAGIKIAVDLPSGLPSDLICENEAVLADFTISFAFPKLSLLFPEHGRFTGKVFVRSIGISDEEYKVFASNFFFLREEDIPPLHKKFGRFSHKGDFGKVLLLGGSSGKMGAMALASKSALRTGSGLVTCWIKAEEKYSLQTSVPEAMCVFGEMNDLGQFDALGIGPGWGLEESHAEVLKTIFEQFQKPVVLDADALNCLAINLHLIPFIPENSILTPHVGEFDRLLGRSATHLDRMKKAKEFAQKHKLIILLKGGNSLISFPDGRQVFNSSGTFYMATGGSGDVLTGMITSFLGQGYSPENAALCGVYHHGLAGELAGEKNRRGTIASDIIDAIPETYQLLNIS
jgi:ADP-dependent NAD(P)H-hydrate dehydratase / NAD(P)H-hydrate epimerase